MIIALCLFLAAFLYTITLGSILVYLAFQEQIELAFFVAGKSYKITVRKPVSEIWAENTNVDGTPWQQTEWNTAEELPTPWENFIEN